MSSEIQKTAVFARFRFLVFHPFSRGSADPICAYVRTPMAVKLGRLVLSEFALLCVNAASGIGRCLHVLKTVIQFSSVHVHGRPHIGANGVSWPPWKNAWKIKKRKHAKRAVFWFSELIILCLCYILRAIRAGRCRERRYADHIFIQIYFRMHHFVVKFSKFSSPQAAMGHWPPLTKIPRTPLFMCHYE